MASQAKDDSGLGKGGSNGGAMQYDSELEDRATEVY